MRGILCLTVALFAAHVLSQDNFPEVPKGHWAYKEIAELRKEGLLKGYPDGLFRGGRPATRYELAVAVHAAWSRHKGRLDGVNDKVLEIYSRSGVPKSGLDRAKLDAAIGRARSSQSLNDGEIRSMQRLLEELQPELKALSASIEKAKISRLENRIGKLERSKGDGT